MALCPLAVSSMSKSALSFKILAECPVTKARVAKMSLPHHVVDTPVFMPVGTQGAMKGVTPKQLTEMDCQIILGNTYHLGNRPGCEILDKAGGLHEFMGWNRALLTDSGGFQMVSLLKLAEITEEGVKFQSPHDNSEMLLTPEQSIAIQNTIGADIIMQLDDVVHVLTTGARVEEAMRRSIRWLDRCIEAHKRTKDQNLFGIVQGGLQPELRKKCIEAMVERDLPGYAIGGLSGGEEKNIFWKIVTLCTGLLPRNKPRYLMGVGFAVDLVVCCALGIDMYDCVYPTRTARCGVALVPWGKLDLRSTSCADKFTPIDPNCTCRTCADHTLASLHLLLSPKETVACNLITIHNIHYQLTLMRSIRQSILDNKFVDFVVDFMERQYPNGDYDQWVVDALESVNITLNTPHESRQSHNHARSTN